MKEEEGRSGVMNVLSEDIGKVKQPRKPGGRWRKEVLLYS